MCEIQMIIGKSLSKSDVEEFKNTLRWGAESNKDAYGYFDQEKIFKKKGAYKGEPLSLSTNPSFIVGHNRYTTNGDAKNNNNNHPFETNRFIMVHNGIINNHLLLRKGKIEGETDSIAIIENIEKGIKKNNVVDAIKKTAERLTGSFSVMLYDKQEKKLYYFKNANTRFSFGRYQFKNRIVYMGSTNEASLKSVYTKWDTIFPVSSCSRRTVIQPEDDTIYEITADGIKSVKSFKPNITHTKPTSTYDNFWNGLGTTQPALTTGIDISYSKTERTRLLEGFINFFKDFFEIKMYAWVTDDKLAFSLKSLKEAERAEVTKELYDDLLPESTNNVGYVTLSSVEKLLMPFKYE